MSPRLQLLHAWQRQLIALLPGVRVTRVRLLALLVLGLLWAGKASLPAVAASWPRPAEAATQPSRERRLRRWLTNPGVDPHRIWLALLPALLADRAGQEVLLVFDPTPQNGDLSILCLGLVAHKRIVPVAWRIMPQQDAWPERQIVSLRAMFAEVAAALPPGCRVTLLSDRGVTSPEVIDLCRAVGWHFVLRVSVSAAQANKVRRPGEEERRLWELITGPGQRLAAPVDLYKEAGWRAVELTIRWERDAAVPWVLVSDRPAGAARVREYRRRMRAEATYQDCKTRGFDLEASRVTDPAAFARLLVAVHLALWWGQQLGLRVIRRGWRHRYDRRDRREVSVLRLGRRWLDDLAAHEHAPPLPFRFRHGCWRFTWLS